MSEKVLIVGNNVRNVCESAKKAGYEVYAITKFVDADLAVYCNEIIGLERCENERDVRKLVEDKSQELKAKVVLCSGYECLDANAEFLGSDPKECRKIVDKLSFYRTLEKSGIPHPEILRRDEGVKALLKPRRGGGGEDVEVFRGEIKDGFILQRYVEGIPCSVSLMVSDRAYPVSCNLILAGWNEMNADGFRYCGNITPLDIDTEKRKMLEKIAVETVELYDLSGSVGVDFILAEKPYVLEINPRFQGSLDSIEWSCDTNLFSLHVDACNGRRIEKPKPVRFGIRAIVFADRKTVIKKNIAGNPFFADVPQSGTIYMPNDPLTSILASGGSVMEVKRKAIQRKELFLRLVV
jgi:hypothetical protein